jgi:FMN phosphatase YigB (HAD superfamily)
MAEPLQHPEIAFSTPLRGAARGRVLRAAVFDLDQTLFDPHTLPRTMIGELQAKLRGLAAGIVSADVLDAALADAWRMPFDRVVARHRLPEAVRTLWYEAVAAVQVTEPLSPYADVVPTLEGLAIRRFVLTTGFRRLQESKLRQLGLTSLFAAVYIDALDPPGPVGKRVLLERLLVEHSLQPSEVMVLGDRADDELASGRALGMVTVQVLRPGVVPSPDVPWRIPDLEALPALLTRLGGAPVV